MDTLSVTEIARDSMSVQEDELEAARLRISAIQNGAMRAQALAFCLRSGLFELLSERRSTPEELRLPPSVVPILLAFLSTQGLVKRDEWGHFHVTPATETFLLQSSPHFAVGGPCGDRTHDTRIKSPVLCLAELTAHGTAPRG